MTAVRSLAQAHDGGGSFCPATPAEYGAFAKEYPMGGMPWGLPTTSTSEHGVLEDWVLAGAPAPSEAGTRRVSSPERTSLSQGDPVALVARWEGFLNGSSHEAQLVGRYLYEHSFQANLHLTENPGEYYRIVRSRTAAPASIDRIVTDTPMDPPGVETVFYRLEKIDRIIEGKTHVVWSLGLGDLDHFRDVFFSEPWSVDAMPGYSSRNPFRIFEAIPARARSRFMIENSRMIYQSYARGPICMVQTASYVVDEYFWVWFLKPESDPSVLEPMLGLPSYASFFTKDGNILSGIPVVGDKYGEPIYRAAFEKTLRRLKPEGLGVDDIWDGHGTNPNAWLTQHRHQVSSDVTTGRERPITGIPRSTWVFSYANFERMYYNGSVQYKYWAGLRHQNDSFNGQTYGRTEAEDLYTTLFPNQRYRDTLRNRRTTRLGQTYNKLFTDYARGRPAKDALTSEDELARTMYNRMGPLCQCT